MVARVFLCVLGLAACRGHAPPSVPIGGASTPAAPSSPSVTSSSADLLVGLVPIAAGGSTIDIEDVGPSIDACEAAGWPEALSREQALAVPEHGIGHHAIVVHPAGVTTVTVAGIACQAAGDIEGPIASLELQAAAPADPSDEPAAGVPGRPHLAIVGATPARTARLVDPVAIDPAGVPALRDGITRVLEAEAADRVSSCEGEGEELPSATTIAAAIPDAVRTAVVHAIRDDDRTLHFAVVQHEHVVFGCYGQPEVLGVLLDPAGDVLLELESNNRIELQWIMDLDGDGTDEALVDMTWMEDGMHDIGVLHGGATTWARTVIWSADTP